MKHLFMWMALVLSFVGAQSIRAANIVNGDFENGNLTGWSAINSGSGSWSNYAGTNSPVSGHPVAAPPQGNRAAMCDQNGPSSLILYQDIVLEANHTHNLTFQTYYYNRYHTFQTPATLSHNSGNQQYRIDVIKPTANPLSLAAGDILSTIFKTNVGDPLTKGPFSLSADLSAFAGQTVRLRFAMADDMYYFQVGVDDVKISSVPTDIYATGNDGSTLIRINTATGAVTTIGATGHSGCFATAFTPNGTLWTIVRGLNSNPQLATFNLVTGAATPVGSPMPGIGAVSLEADTFGNLYAAGMNDAKFYSVNKTTGQLTLIGNTGIGSIMDMAFDTSGKLWMINTTNSLYSINKSTGVATFEKAITGGVNGEMGLAVGSDGTFYLTEYTGSPRLFKMNPATGVATVVGPMAGTFYPHGGDILVSAVTPVNDAPVAENGTLTTDEDAAANGTLSATDVDGDVLTYSIVANGSKGTATITDAATGAYTYTPNADANGTDSFTFKANDGTVDSNTATINVTINPVNDAPVAIDDAETTDEDTALNGTMSATDVDGDTLTYSKVTDPAHGSVIVNADGSFTYTPEADYHGTDNFTFNASDGTVDSNVATVSITVESVNDAPVAVDDVASTDEDTAVTIDALANDTDVDGDTLTVTSVTATNGTATINADGKIKFSPEANFNGTATINYTVSDGNGGTANAIITVTVTPVNDAPVAENGALTTDEDAAANGTLSATDVDGDVLTYSKVDDPAHGTVTVNANGSFTYTPATNYHGPDSFTFKANDGTVDSNTATVFITVNSVNDQPVAVDDTATTPANASVTIDVLANDTDVDGDTLSVASFTQGTLGAVTQNADGTLTYTPYGVLGADSFTYEASDGNGGTDEGTVTITVTLPASSADAKVTGGGGLDTEQGRPSFTVNAQVKKDGRVDGNFGYGDSPTGVYIRSTKITAVLLSPDGTIARIYGEATLNGAGTHALMVDLHDGGEPGKDNDYIRVTLDGAIVAEGALARGNIEVHKVK